MALYIILTFFIIHFFKNFLLTAQKKMLHFSVSKKHLTKRSKKKMKKEMFKKVIAGVIVSLLFLSCNVPAGQVESTVDPSYANIDAFMEKNVIAGENGYLVEGCILFDSMEDVEEYYNDTYTEGSKSSIHIHNGQYDKWNNTDKLNLTYKVTGFGSNQSYMVSALQTATDAWEAGINIDFTDVTSTGGSALMTIRPATSYEEQQMQGVAAMAFFPYSSAKKEVAFFTGFFKMNMTQRMYVVKHEMGHTLGLRHEHIWRNNQQVEETDARAQLLTAHDTASIMYYDTKPGYTGNKDLSHLDKEGVKILYGAKNTNPTPTATPTTIIVNPTATPTTITGVQPWDASKVYLGGELVTYNGSTWKCLWWNQGNAPGSTQWGPWELVDGPIATPTPIINPTTPTPTPTQGTGSGTWAAGTAYSAGDQVTYQGTTYTCLQPHTAITGWEPPNVPALWSL